MSPFLHGLDFYYAISSFPLDSFPTFSVSRDDFSSLFFLLCFSAHSKRGDSELRQLMLHLVSFLAALLSSPSSSSCTSLLGCTYIHSVTSLTVYVAAPTAAR